MLCCSHLRTKAPAVHPGVQAAPLSPSPEHQPVAPPTAASSPPRKCSGDRANAPRPGWVTPRRAAAGVAASAVASPPQCGNIPTPFRDRPFASRAPWMGPSLAPCMSPCAWPVCSPSARIEQSQELTEVYPSDNEPRLPLEEGELTKMAAAPSADGRLPPPPPPGPTEPTRSLAGNPALAGQPWFRTTPGLVSRKPHMEPPPV